MSLLANIKFIIIGGGGHARVIADLLNILGAEIIGYVDNHNTGLLENYLGDEEKLNQYPNVHYALGIGGKTSTQMRHEIAKNYPKQLFLPLIHPRATIGEAVVLDYGVQVMAGAILEANTTIGYGTIINSGAVINHDTKVGEFCHIAPMVNICGNCTIGDNSVIGPSAVIASGVNIPANSLIPAGAVCLQKQGKLKINRKIINLID